MVSNIRLLGLLSGVFVLLACDPDPQASELSQRWSGHDWSANHPQLVLDINNDGVEERALIGFGKRTIIVAVYRQQDVTKMDFVELFVNKPNQQNSICGAQAELEIESQKFSVEYNVSPAPQGYRYCPECQGLRLIDTQGCDPFHIYWDHDNQMLSWWRN